MYKIIKNVYKIRFRRDHFKTCNIWAKRNGLSVVIKILSPMDCLPLPEAIYTYMVKHEKKMYIKSDLKAIGFKPATNGQSDMGFVLASTFVTKGLSVPALGLYTCIKGIQIYTMTSYQVSVYRTTGPLVCLRFCDHLT